MDQNTGGKPHLLPPPYIKTGILECLIQRASRIELVEGPEKKKKISLKQKRKASKGKSASKAPQSCPTLCDPTDGSPPGSPVPGILQARTLEWVAISFSNA